ncbi:major facilitator superfamily domain-containing protein [Hypoxylon cercidicola]|nr:major facilitator superfamily domain-containing protein [Hypoxylon cercidicola]
MRLDLRSGDDRSGLRKKLFVAISHALLAGHGGGGHLPGSIYLISFWYKREEAQKRFTAYWSSTLVAGAFGGFLSSAITNMDGVGGLTSWRWVFILEGLATVLVGFAAFFFFCISDFPRQAKWPSEGEWQLLLEKIEPDESHTIPVTSKDTVIFLSRATNWLGALITVGVSLPSRLLRSAEYAAICLTAMGSNGIVGHVVCWYVMNLQGHVERSLGSAWMICFGGFAGFVATFAFLKKDSPYYRTGYSINLATASLCVVAHLCYGLLILREKKAMDRNGGGKTAHTLYL